MIKLLRQYGARLAVRIYLVGLLQVLTVLAGMGGLIALIGRPPSPPPLPPGMSAEIHNERGLPLEHHPLSRPHAPPPGPPLVVFWSWIALVLVVVGVTSLLLARTVVRPLARLAAAAREFGAGKLEARARGQYSGELGQVATAFDQMADRLACALRVEKELLANVSHELRTPLQRIHLAMELAAEGGDSTARESLREITEDLAELERIVNDVLTASKLSLVDGTTDVGNTASPPLRAEWVDIRSLLEKSVARFRKAHPERRLAVTVSVDLPLISVDPVLIRRAVDNLLDNAHKYTEEPEAEIALATYQCAGSVLVEVRDRGIGMSPHDLANIFKPFFRVDASRTRATGGLGLGLALARRIVEAHGGKLIIMSTAGAGTTATIELPAPPA